MAKEGSPTGPSSMAMLTPSAAPPNRTRSAEPVSPPPSPSTVTSKAGVLSLLLRLVYASVSTPAQDAQPLSAEVPGGSFSVWPQASPSSSHLLLSCIN